MMDLRIGSTRTPVTSAREKARDRHRPCMTSVSSVRAAPARRQRQADLAHTTPSGAATAAVAASVAPVRPVRTTIAETMAARAKPHTPSEYRVAGSIGIWCASASFGTAAVSTLRPHRRRVAPSLGAPGVLRRIAGCWSDLLSTGPTVTTDAEQGVSAPAPTSPAAEDAAQWRS